MHADSRAEALWEELGGDLCVCQRADVPHWCESCQQRIALIATAFQRRETAIEDADPAVTFGSELIRMERVRQITSEGWTAEHDDAHGRGELARAAACYALQHTSVSGRAIRWPWDRSWWKPSGEPMRNLAKAGALISAEIDRLSRKGSR